MSVDEVLILPIKNFNRRQGESQQEIAEQKQKMEVWRVVKRMEPDRVRKKFKLFF